MTWIYYLSVVGRFKLMSLISICNGLRLKNKKKTTIFISHWWARTSACVLFSRRQRRVLKSTWKTPFHLARFALTVDCNPSSNRASRWMDPIKFHKQLSRLHCNYVWMVSDVRYVQMAETQFAWLTHMIIKWALFVLLTIRASFNWTIRTCCCLLYRLCYDVWNSRIFLEIESDAIVVKFVRVLTLTFVIYEPPGFLYNLFFKPNRFAYTYQSLGWMIRHFRYQLISLFAMELNCWRPLKWQ